MSRRNQGTLALPFLLPSFLGFILFSILPMIVALLVSVTNWDGLSELTLFRNPAGFMQEFFVGLSNYTQIFRGEELYKVLGNTMKFVLLYLPLMFVMSFAVALVLNHGRRFTGIFRVLYYIPVITSWVAGALIWRSALNPEYGIVNGLLGFFGIAGPKWLQSPVWAMPAIVLASVWKDMGYFGLMIFSGLRSINKDYYEAASIDGAGKLLQFGRITMPMLSPTLFFVTIISLINSFQIFPQVMVMTPDGGPGGSTMVMVERIYTYGFKYYKMGYSSALSWILFLVILTLTFVQMKLQDKWVTYDG